MHVLVSTTPIPAHTANAQLDAGIDGAALLRRYGACGRTDRSA